MLIKDVISTITVCSQMMILANQEQELRDGQTNPVAMHYEISYYSATWMMFIILDIPMTMPLLAWYYNPYGFLGIQCVNLLLYYAGIYAACESGNTNNSLQFESFSNNSKMANKREAQTRFIFAITGFFGLEQIIVPLRTSVHDWLFSKIPSDTDVSDDHITLSARIYYHLYNLRRINLEYNSTNKIITSVVTISTEILRLIFLTTLNIAEQLSWVMHKSGLGRICQPILAYGAFIGLHAISINMVRTAWMANTLTALNVTTLAIAGLTMLNYYQLLAPRIRDYIFKLSTISHLFIPFVSSDPRRIITSLFEGVAMLTMISNRIGKLILRVGSMMCSTSFRKSPIYWIPMALLKVFKSIVSRLFGEKWVTIAEELTQTAFLFVNPESTYRKWADILNNWRHEADQTVKQNPFKLTKINGETHASSRYPDDQVFIEEVWKPHLTQFLKMQEIYPYAEPLAAAIPEDTTVQTFPNIAGFDPENREFKLSHDDKKLGHAIKWNLKSFRTTTFNRPTASWWQKAKSFFSRKRGNDVERVCEFFNNHATTTETIKLLDRDASGPYNAIFLNSNNTRNRLDKLLSYLTTWYAHAQAKTSTLTARQKLDDLWVRAWAIMVTMIDNYPNATTEKKHNIEKDISRITLLILENIEKCSGGFLPALSEIVSDFEDHHGASITATHFVRQLKKNDEMKAQRLAAIMKDRTISKCETNFQTSMFVGSKCTTGGFTPVELDDADNCFFLNSFMPESTLFSRLSMQSSLVANLEENNRHINNLCRAMYGLNVESGEYSQWERSAMGMLLPFAEAVNLEKTHLAKPFGLQYRDGFWNQYSDNPVLPASFFKSSKGPSLFYSELIKMLEDECYLDFLDSNDNTTEKLTQLINAQVNIHNSPIRILAIYRYFLHIEGITPTWHDIAAIIETIDSTENIDINTKSVENHIFEHLSNENAAHDYNFYEQLSQPISYYKEKFEEFTNKACLNYLENPYKVYDELKETIKSIDNVNKAGNHPRYKLSCFINDENRDIEERFNVLESLPKADQGFHDGMRLYEDGRKIRKIFDSDRDARAFFMNSSHDTRIKLLDEDVAQLNIDKIIHSCCNHLHNQIVMPITLTLLLKAGVIYRGADATNSNPDSIYPTVEAVQRANNTPVRSQQNTSSWQLVRSTLSTCATVTKLLLLHILPTIVLELITLGKIASKHLALFAFSIVTTALYWLPRGLALKVNRYIYEPMLLPIQRAIVAKSSEYVYKPFLRPVLTVMSRLNKTADNRLTVRSYNMKTRATRSKEANKTNGRSRQNQGFGLSLFTAKPKRSNKPSEHNSTMLERLGNIIKAPLGWVS